MTGWSLVLAHRADYTPKPFVDESGALVHPCAYQQILKGYPAVDYAARDLIYAPRNLRPGRVYGFSPVEQIVMTANIALKRQIFTLTHFTEGNIPESLIGVPETWTPDQIKNFQDYWDAYFTGDLATRRRAKFVPGGVAKTFIQTKEPELKNLFDEWLARVVCYAFSVSPQAFVHQLNRATGETQKELAEEEGLWPILKWVKRLIDRVLTEDFGEEEVEFAWGEDAQIDASQQAQVLTSYVAAGILTRNEARAQLGAAPVEDEAANALLVTTGSGPAPLPELAATSATLGKYNTYHDERGRFTTSSGARILSPAPDLRNHDPRPKGVQVATGPGVVHSGETSPQARGVEHWINRAQDWLMGGAGGKGKDSASPTTSQGAAAGSPNPDEPEEPEEKDSRNWPGLEAARKKVPTEWGEGRVSNKGDGWRWENPDYEGDGVRVDKGRPDSSLPSQREDHVVIRSGGKVLGADGDPIQTKIKADPENAHIPLEDWLRWREWNKP